MEFISAKEAAAKWGISQRRVAVLCNENRIENAAMVGNMWIIPKNAEKPLDGRSNPKSDNSLKPFLKWAGGKGQLLKEIEAFYPFDDKITKYVEPFVGGGAVLFDILNKYTLKQIYISDVNKELINTYQCVRNNIDDIIYNLYLMQNEYIPLNNEDRKAYYLNKRDRFNLLKIKSNKGFKIERASLMIFLNKTCFNGLYRVNKKGLFNVPMGAYKKPLICDENNLRAVSAKLQRVEIAHADYRAAMDYIDENTFVYFDPPYRPINETSSFTAYTEYTFNDAAQRELAEFAREVDKTGARFVLSNSDPKNFDENDDFFDEIYKGFSIERISATRMINSKGDSRSKFKGLIIYNN